MWIRSNNTESLCLTSVQKEEFILRALWDHYEVASKNGKKEFWMYCAGKPQPISILEGLSGIVVYHLSEVLNAVEYYQEQGYTFVWENIFLSR